MKDYYMEGKIWSPKKLLTETLSHITRCLQPSLEMYCGYQPDSPAKFLNPLLHHQLIISNYYLPQKTPHSNTCTKHDPITLAY